MVKVKPQFLNETIFRALKTYCGTRKYQYIFSSLCKCRCRWVYSTLEGKSGGGIFQPFGGMLLPAKTVACFREFPGNWRTRALGQQILEGWSSTSKGLLGPIRALLETHLQCTTYRPYEQGDFAHRPL